MMKAMRIGLFCALVGGLTAEAGAQMGTYGSPDPIPLGQPYAPQYAAAYPGQYAPQYAAPPAGQYAPQYAAPPVGQYAPTQAGPYVQPYAAAPQGQYPQYAPPSAGQYASATAGPYARPYSYPPAVAARPSYLATDDSPPPALAPYNAIPQPPTAGALPPPSTSALPPPATAAPQPSSESSAVSSLLSEPNGTFSGPSGCSVMPSGGYMKNAGNCETCGSGCGGCSGGCGCCCGDCCSPWYFSAEALYMTRNSPNSVYTSAEANNQAVQGIFNQYNWTPGAQGTLGYRFGCNCEWGIQGTYWGLAESSSDGGPGIPGPYVSPFIFHLTDILGTTGGGGTNGDQTANAFTDGSPDHHTWRNFQAQDVEISVVRNLLGGECNRLDLDFIGGFRWFRFQDGMIWGAQRANDGTAYANDWLYLNDHVNNDLFGGQIGLNASYRFADCWKVFVTPMVGLYDNHMTLDYNLYAVNGTTGQQYQGSSQTYSNPNYPVHSTNDGLSVLTQVDVGLDWQVTKHLSTQFGYRLVAATGMGLSDNQIPFYGNDTQAIANIQHNGDLILHGAFAGLTFTW